VRNYKDPLALKPLPFCAVVVLIIEVCLREELLGKGIYRRSLQVRDLVGK
jgi:hypothetical protein